MPLLRQSLYAQNVNLYLAPTADNRDAWLPLMRTVALEGRCFVVSSNMCVRENPPHEHGGHEVERAGGAGGRRNSCLTEDGFEIALPASPTATASGRPQLASKGRRKSVIDEDGNEIALADANGAHASSSSAVVEAEDEKEMDDDNRKAHAHALALVKAPAKDTFVSRGGSCIVSPFGDVLAGPQWEDEKGIIYADVDFDDCVRGRLDLDAAGSYSRYDCILFLLSHISYRGGIKCRYTWLTRDIIGTTLSSSPSRAWILILCLTTNRMCSPLLYYSSRSF